MVVLQSNLTVVDDCYVDVGEGNGVFPTTIHAYHGLFRCVLFHMDFMILYGCLGT